MRTNSIVKDLLCLLIIIICGTAAAEAQSATITGRIRNEKNAGVPFTNIALLTADNKLVKGVLSDSSGNFSIKNITTGKYLLQVTSIGYADFRSPQFEITKADELKDFGPISLKDDNKKLNDVTVQSLRPTITQKADRMVVSVEGTAMAAGNTAYAVLAKTPGVFIDQDGNIQLNGKSGVNVMIDGKQTYLSARDLRSMLESMPAENLKNIEIIVNPSAKFDAEGTSGILNINLKKNDRQGINGSIFAGHNFNGKLHGYSGGGNINYKAGKWNSFANVDIAQFVGGRDATFTRIFAGTQQTTYFNQVATGKFIVNGPPSIRLGSDYNITKDHSVGFTGRFGTNTVNDEFLSDTYLGTNPSAPATFIAAKNYRRNTFTNYAGNVHYSGKMDTIGSTLSADLDYVKIKNDGRSNFINYYTNQVTKQTVSDLLSAATPNSFDIYAGKIDYSKSFKNGQKFETGAKASHVVADNDSRFYINNGPSPVLDLNRTNHFKYAENIIAGYLNWSGNLNKKITVQLGLRGENTQSTGNLLTNNLVTKRNYFNLFPSFFMQQKVSDNYGINYSYSRRLSRPNYGNLNPFRFYRDPYTWSQGNPNLRPQYSNVMSITQTFKKNYNLIVSYVYTTDVIAELPSIIADSSATIYYTGNVNNSSNLSVTAIAPIRVMKNWDINNTVLLAYQKFDMQVEKQSVVNDQLFFMIQSNHTIVLPKEFRIEMNMLYRGRAISGLYRMDPWVRIDFGFKKSFMQKKFDLSFNISDAFKGQQFRFKTTIGNNINDFDQYLRFRSFSTTLRYNFSKGIKVDTKKRNNNLDELNRAGGN
jgi:hypothetical protein